MKYLIPYLALIGCAPQQLVAINDAVNERVTYKHYYAKDYRYLKSGDSGNCAAIAYTKTVDTLKAGISAKTEVCYRASDNEPHAYTVAELMGRKWVMDGQYVIEYNERDCK